MNIVKFRHACLVVEKDGQFLVIDPGEWSTDFVVPNAVAGVIVTHQHSDHFSPEKLREIAVKNPGVKMYAHHEVASQAPDLPMVGVDAGETRQIGNFTVTFTGGEHARVFPEKPVCANLGVVLDGGELYYPGDSLVVPNLEIKTLALPISAPWLKLSEALDFLVAVKPKEVIATHDALLSSEGQAVTAAWLTRTAESANIRVIATR